MAAVGEMAEAIWRNPTAPGHIYALSGRISYRNILWSLEAVTFRCRFSNISEIWQAPRQQRSDMIIKNLQSRGSETSRDLAVCRPTA